MSTHLNKFSAQDRELVEFAYANPDMRSDLMPLLQKLAKKDPAEEASAIIMEELDQARSFWQDVEKSWKEAQKELKGLQGVGAGDTEAVKIMNKKIKSKVKDMVKNFQGLIKYMGSL